MKQFMIGVLLAFAWMANATEWRIDVRNSAYDRRDLVVSHEVNQQWVELMKDHTLAEVTDDGRKEPVPCVMDESGEHPVLSWLMGGATAADQKRSFELVSRDTVAVLAGGLAVVEREDRIEIENRDYRLWQPVKGRGGFPQEITYARSGFMDNELYFLDRLVCAAPQGGIQQFSAKDCAGARTKLLFNSPLRAVVETTTGFGPDGTDATDRAQVTYRYSYTAFSPVIEVSASYLRGDSRVWREVHFLHLSREKQGPYKEVLTGSPLRRHPLNAKGEKSAAVSGANWAVLSDGVNSCGAGYRDVLCWDASDEFVYYIRSGHRTWEAASLYFEGALYIGPGSDETVYDSWMGIDHRVEIRFVKDGHEVLPIDQPPVVGKYTLENSDLKIAFASAEQGFDCLGIENTKADEIRFVNPHDGLAGFWRLTFKGPAGTNGVRETVEIDNHTPAAKRFADQKKREMVFTWEGMDLPGEPAAVDVIAHVTLDKATGESRWRLSVQNRSQVYGLWESDYPVLLSVAKPGKGDLVAPRGNWGGSLLKNSNGTQFLNYPSHSCPVQCLAYQMGVAGLYIAAHDGAASAKSLVINTSQDVTWRQPAANAGVAGAACAPEYPVVIAAYTGSWWEMARRYRGWALQQQWTSKGAIKERSDYPQNLKDLSFWMITSGGAESVQNTMQRAAGLFPGLTIGTHWYNWHVIPFDNSYPEYFPTKPGVAEATKKMTGDGQVIMPYINGRLWDRDIESFKGAIPAACKQPSGDFYVEHYGVNSRNLVPMCPYTAFWQSRVTEICTRLVDEVGVNSIYLDQIGAAKPGLCYDPSHGHPVGGGHHWVDGYRTMLTPIKSFCVERGVSLTTENTAKPYMDNIDAYLTWNPRYETDIPLLPAIYSGYTVYFSSPQAREDTLEAFCAAQGRDFLWGCQLGWNDGWILEEPHRAKQKFQYELCQYRARAREFFLYGQFLDDLKFDGEMPHLQHTWNRSTPHAANLPVVMGTIWRSPDGSDAIFLINAGAEPQKVRFDLSKQDQLKGRRTWKVQRMTLEGVAPDLESRGAVEIEMAPHCVTGYRIK